MDLLLLIASFAVILAGALLFTNAVEWIGYRLKLGDGAVGSLLAAVGTAMPETLIAIVALLEGSKSEDVAIGAIVGAPFRSRRSRWPCGPLGLPLPAPPAAGNHSARPRSDPRSGSRLLPGVLRARLGPWFNA
jgi:hypothetical protein